MTDSKAEWRGDGVKEYWSTGKLNPQIAWLPACARVPAVPARQLLPAPVMDPAKPLLKLGLDVHLEFIRAVAQKDHANPRAP